MRDIVEKRQRFEIGKLIIVGVIIILYAALGYINKTIVGALIGAIVGYFFGAREKLQPANK